MGQTLGSMLDRGVGQKLGQKSGQKRKFTVERAMARPHERERDAGAELANAVKIELTAAGAVMEGVAHFEGTRSRSERVDFGESSSSHHAKPVLDVVRRWLTLLPALFAVGVGAVMGMTWNALSNATPKEMIDGSSQFSSGAVSSAAWPALLGVGSGAGGAAAWITADRDAGELITLDADLLVLRRIPMERPVELAPRSDRRFWLACAGPAGPLDPHTLRCIRHDGTVDFELTLRPVFDLDVLDGGDALIVEPSGTLRRAFRVDLSGAVSTLATAADLFCITGRDGEVLVGTETGRLDLYANGSIVPVVSRVFGGVIADLAPGPRARTWWVLDAHGGPNAHRVALLDESLNSVWERSAGIAALHLVAVPNAERVWLSDANSNLARRFGPGGALEISGAQLAMNGADRGVARADGSVIFAAPGALCALAADGQALPGQGGFNFLVDIEPASAR